MPGACAGLRVLDFTRGLAGPMATMILADFGAEVVRVEPPEGDPGWDEPVYLVLNRGKKSITVDVGSEEGQAALRRVVAGFDVVVESLGPQVMERAGLGYEACAALNPGLVYCSVTGYGPTGPFADVKAHDGLVLAKGGIFKNQAGWHQDGRRPIYRASRDASYFTGMLTVQGIVAALRARDLTGRGQLVQTNMLQALSCRQNPAVRWLLRDGEALPSEQDGKGGVQDDQFALPHHKDPREISLIGMMVETKDGRWITHSLTEPHFFPAWISTIGFDWIWDDERFKGAPFQFPDDDAKVELVQRIQARMKEQTAAEWMDAYLANGNVCGDLVQTTQDALRHPQSVAAELVVEIEDARVGTILEIGPIAKIPGAPAEVRSAAPIPGEHTEEILAAEVTPNASPTPTALTLDGPLAGITIVECAYYYATPFATSLLTELGARVIKVEPVRGDPYRSMGYGNPQGDPVCNLGHNNMARAMQGKESIALNLKDPRGQEILHKLIARSDVFIHSFRRGVPESLGIDEATLRKVNPRLTYQYGASYGSVGPWARQPAIDPIIAAYAGTTIRQAGEGNTPLTENGADPVAALGHATALVLGIFAAHRTGEPQFVESSMIVSNLYLNIEDALSYDGKPPRLPVDGLQLGTGATSRLYETAPVDASSRRPESYENPDPRWVFLAVERDDEFARFCAVIGRDDLATDARFATRGARASNRDALADLLALVFLTRTAEDWETSLLAAGVGCVRADAMSNFAFLYRDAQALATDMMTEAAHPSFGGKYHRHAPLVRFSETLGQARPFCEFAEHTRAILEELGYDGATIAELEHDQVVASPMDEAEAVASTA